MVLIYNSLSLVDAHQRRHVVILVVLLLCQALLDVISVASMAPLALLIIQPSVLLHSPALLTVYQIFDFHEVRDFSIALLCFFITFLILKYFFAEKARQYSFIDFEMNWLRFDLKCCVYYVISINYRE